MRQGRPSHRKPAIFFKSLFTERQKSGIRNPQALEPANRLHWESGEKFPDRAIGKIPAIAATCPDTWGTTLHAIEFPLNRANRNKFSAYTALNRCLLDKSLLWTMLFCTLDSSDLLKIADTITKLATTQTPRRKQKCLPEN